MFEDDYKKAYDKIKADQDSISRILSKNADRHKKSSLSGTWKWAAAAMACIICVWNVLPACAANIPTFYKVLENVSPGIADFFVPVEKSCSSQGIIMQVEAINLNGNQAEIIVSFQDEDGSDKIQGQSDLFDRYGLKSYDSESWLGGSSFIRYDENEDKAYFMISVQSEETFDRDKLTFYSYSLLCGITKEKRDIDLSAVQSDVKTKSVIISGRGGSGDISAYSEFLLGKKEKDNPRDAFLVLSPEDTVSQAADDFTITGIACQNDILRVQICMGDNTEADRHVQPFLINKDGEERHEDYSISWMEEAGDTSYQYYEYWFFGPFDNLEDCRMYGIFHNSGELIEGDWSVTFRLEP